MKVEMVIALTALALGPAQQRGAVSSVSAVSAPSGASTVIRISGSNPCSTVRVEFGDGTMETHNVHSMPADVRHVYAQPGTYRVRATGAGDCRGAAYATVRIQAGVSNQPPAGSGNMRFQGMDRNGDGQITRQEWRGSEQSFRVHDWNNDGVLSGAEVRSGTTPPWNRDPDYVPNTDVLSDWSEQRFQRLDTNGDSRISRREWLYDYEAFQRADRNRDGVLTRQEFLGTPDWEDDRLDQFDYLDLNGNNRIERSEWHSTAATFQWLDQNRDGVLSRSEMAGADVETLDQFERLDVNRDRSLTVEEWQWSRTSFNRLDRNGDGRISRAEFDAAGPLGADNRSAPIVVPSTDRWTDTGIYVRAGDLLTFEASGTIEMSGESGDPADPRGSRTGRLAPNAPLPNESAGVLLARIGTGTPAPVGRTRELRASTSGRLYLGVNDDHLPDNHGEFTVVVTVRRGS